MLFSLVCVLVLNLVYVNGTLFEAVDTLAQDFFYSRKSEQTERVCHLTDFKLCHVEDKLKLVFFVVAKKTDKSI